MDALARAHLDVLAGRDARDVVVVGASFGAWVAARMAVDDVRGRIGALVLVGPLGARARLVLRAAPPAHGARTVIDNS